MPERTNPGEAVILDLGSQQLNGFVVSVSSSNHILYEAEDRRFYQSVYFEQRHEQWHRLILLDQTIHLSDTDALSRIARQVRQDERRGISVDGVRKLFPKDTTVVLKAS